MPVIRMEASRMGFCTSVRTAYSYIWCASSCINSFIAIQTRGERPIEGKYQNACHEFSVCLHLIVSLFLFLFLFFKKKINNYFLLFLFGLLRCVQCMIMTKTKNLLFINRSCSLLAFGFYASMPFVFNFSFHILSFLCTLCRNVFFPVLA